MIGLCWLQVSTSEDKAENRTIDLFDPKTTRPAFTIQNPPSSQDTLQLTLDLLAQDKHRREKDNDCVFEIPAGTDLRGGLNGKSDVREIYHQDLGV